MERRYVPLRSAAPAADIRHEMVGFPEPLESKKRRVSILVACNECRRRKIRCNGQRPVCLNCYGQTNQCTYRDESDLPPDSKKLVVEIIRILNSLPAAEAIETLESLRTETNASIILSTLRGRATSRHESSIDSDAIATINDMAEQFEFEVQNPTAYPIIPPSDPQELGQQSWLGLSGSSKHSWAPLPSERDSVEDLLTSTDLPYDSSSRRSSHEMRSLLKIEGQVSPRKLCDPRLRELNIRKWTNVDIDDEMAASCISLYLETDHPLLGHFDPELFVSHLVSGRTKYCSSLLVNALLYWACQMYSTIDPEIDALVMSFCTEAERLWAIERNHEQDSIMNVAAAEFLCLGYIGQGRDHAILKYVSEASNMGNRMGLFGVQNTIEDKGVSEVMDEAIKARMYAAWGVFNWITLMSLFYRQPGLFCPKYPPCIAIPEFGPSDESVSGQLQSPYMGKTFPYICRFWKIVHEVSIVYHGDGQLPWGSGSTLAFAEFKFRELLAWSDGIPSRFSQGRDHLHHIQILHLWFHAAILDVFRPCCQVSQQGQHHLRTFSGVAATPDAVCAASVAQLRHIITVYRLNCESSAYSILWHTALIYVTNAILDGDMQENEHLDLLSCIYAYEILARSWRVAAAIAKSLLSLAMQKSKMSSHTARRILHDLKNDRLDVFFGEIRATFMADLNLALTDPSSATVEYLAQQFEDNVLLKEYTTVLDSMKPN